MNDYVNRMTLRGIDLHIGSVCHKTLRSSLEHERLSSNTSCDK